MTVWHEPLPSILGFQGPRAGFPSNRGDIGLMESGWPARARVGRGQAGPARSFCLLGAAEAPGSRAARRAVARTMPRR